MKNKNGLKIKWYEFENYYKEFVKELKHTKIRQKDCPICQTREETTMTAPEEQDAYGRTCPVCETESFWA